MKIVEIIWHDHFSDNNWMAVEDVQEWGKSPYVVRTSGYLAYENDEVVVVSQNYGEWEDTQRVSGTISIIKSCIKSISVVKDDETGKKATYPGEDNHPLAT